ncbi:MAG: DEAD/DEAH box helicase family protein [Planctomycetes bacterium]|nr:DEAD/DEAH box helicase family protein [Planctomycetota bacterium]HPY74626.1 DEAD/DEAH box helicase family protein [Planctomycetota bacterium]HQB00378.1 DEAD/DEAH box helicase family protein [Planctomycetota bacterium]
MISIKFDQGTLTIDGNEYAYLIRDIPYCQWDLRTGCYRMPAYQYYSLITILYDHRLQYDDQARQYKQLDLPQPTVIPFPFQKEAIQAWINAYKRGVIVLPTGTGKSYVGVLAIAVACRSTMIVVPTIDLMHQWYDVLKTHFPDAKIGLIGGGYYEPSDITITTYDSAYRHMEHLGNRYGLIIYDECHHLPSPTYKMSAECSIAPYRLGLSATPERVDGGHYQLHNLIGPLIYRKSITEMSGQYLADYEVIEIRAQLSQEERQEYQHYRTKYLNFLRSRRINISRNWARFIIETSRSKEGREAFLAYRKQKEITYAAPAKIKILTNLLKKHKNQRILIFTQDNATAYYISKEFLVPVITHQTKTKERREYLLGFNKGTYTILATSKVLNEGVNVPAANIGIILSGSASVREHVQRLGRILRKYNNKQALLYEIVTDNTAEQFVSRRRRHHEAYLKK